MRKIETDELINYVDEKLNEVSKQIDSSSSISKNIILENENQILLHLKWLIKNGCNESR
jgi:hypothetical protein